MNELLDKYFTSSTLQIAGERLIIKYDETSKEWVHYIIQPYVDEDPDHDIIHDNDNTSFCYSCDEDITNNGCKFDKLDPEYELRAIPIDNPDGSVNINGEFCDWKEIIFEIDRAEEMGYADVQAYGIRHADNLDWSTGVEITPLSFTINRVGWILTIPRPEFQVRDSSADLDHVMRHGL